MSICLGFGEFKNICTNEAGTLWTPYWCSRCDKLRRRSISESLETILNDLKESKSCRER